MNIDKIWTTKIQTTLSQFFNKLAMKMAFHDCLLSGNYCNNLFIAWMLAFD